MNLKKLAALVLAVGALAAAGCGGDDSSSEATATSTAPYDITLGEWVVDLEDEKTEILKAYVADTPSCNADADRGFVLEIAAVSTDYDSSTPLPDVVDKYC